MKNKLMLEKVLTSMEVAKMVRKDHSHLLRDIEKYIKHLKGSQNPNLDSDNFFIESSYTAGTGKNYKCYNITRKGCEFIANKLTGQKGALFTASYVTRFHEMELGLQTPQFNIPTTLPEALRLAADLAEEVNQLSQKIEADRPLVQYAKDVQTADTDITVGAFAKLIKNAGLDIGRIDLYKWLRQKGYLMSQKSEWNLPVERYKKMGVFVVRQTVITLNGEDKVLLTPLVTPKGQMYLINKLKGDVSL